MIPRQGRCRASSTQTPTCSPSGSSAFDPVSRQLYFLSGGIGSQQLITADLQSSTTSTHSIAIPAAYIFFVWDSTFHRILAVTSAGGSPVVSIDPATGSVQTLFNTNIGGPSFGFGTFDPVTRRLYFLSGGFGSQQVVIADLTNNTVTTRSIA